MKYRVLASLAAFMFLATPMAVCAQSTAVPGKVIIHVDANDASTMNLALANTQNLFKYYKEKGETIEIEVIANGPGLHMLRSDSSPVKERLTTIAQENPGIKFSACANTIAAMEKQEGKKPALVNEAAAVPSGAVRIVELQKQGYAYLKP